MLFNSSHGNKVTIESYAEVFGIVPRGVKPGKEVTGGPVLEANEVVRTAVVSVQRSPLLTAPGHHVHLLVNLSPPAQNAHRHLFRNSDEFFRQLVKIFWSERCSVRFLQVDTVCPFVSSRRLQLTDLCWVYLDVIDAAVYHDVTGISPFGICV